MANYLYNERTFSQLITTQGPQATVSVTDKYLPNAMSVTSNSPFYSYNSSFPPYYNSFHNYSANRNDIAVFINYSVADTQIYSRDVCAINVIDNTHPVNTLTYQADPYCKNTINTITTNNSIPSCCIKLEI